MTPRTRLLLLWIAIVAAVVVAGVAWDGHVRGPGREPTPGALANTVAAFAAIGMSVATCWVGARVLLARVRAGSMPRRKAVAAYLGVCAGTVAAAWIVASLYPSSGGDWGGAASFGALAVSFVWAAIAWVVVAARIAALRPPAGP